MLYRGFTREELAQEYSPSSMVGGDLTPYISGYAALSAQARNTLPVKENLTFGAKATRVLDYFPAKTENSPLHIFIHGGYWQALSQRESAMMAPALIENGQAFATLNYTLAPDARLGEMIAECKSAIKWLAKNTAELGFDPSKVTISGHSAGGHLAAMVMARFWEELAQSGMIVQEVILISGVFDLEPIALTPVNDPIQLTTEEILGLSPVLHLPAVGPRYVVTVADGDTDEFIRQSREYAELLRKAGRSVCFELKKGMHHFDIILHAATFLPRSAGQSE